MAIKLLCKICSATVTIPQYRQYVIAALVSVHQLDVVDVDAERLVKYIAHVCI